MTRKPHHPGPPVRLPRAYELAVYLLASGVALSGVLWLIFEHYVRIDGAFGPEHHWLQHCWLVAHGVLAMLAVWGYGVLLPQHAQRGWQHRRHRRSGASLYTLVATLAITGLLLYYAGNDTLRHWTSLVHWLLGLVACVALIVHASIAYRQRNRPRAADAP